MGNHEYVLFDNVSCEEVARGAFDDCMSIWRQSPRRTTSHLVVRPVDAFNTAVAQRRVRLLRDRMATHAPEMLAALKKALRDARDAMPAADRQVFDAGRGGPEWMITVRDAIAKAEGGE